MELKEQVASNQSALFVGSGDLDVYSTPSMIALMERTSKQCIAGNLKPGETTVGGAVNIRHMKPTAVGAEVYCESRVKAFEHPRVEFEVAVIEGSEIVGKGTHIRFIVDSKKFMKNL